MLSGQTWILNRRMYCTLSWFLWYVERYDKLKSFGLYNFGAIDEYSCRIMGLDVGVKKTTTLNALQSIIWKQKYKVTVDESKMCRLSAAWMLIGSWPVSFFCKNPSEEEYLRMVRCSSGTCVYTRW